MKRVLQVFLFIVLIVSGITLYNLLRDAQWAHSWFKRILVMLPEFGTLIAILELHHSAKANELRDERNRLARANNELEQELQTERNAHLAEIARRMQRPQSVAERNAAKLREHLGSPVFVINVDNSTWGISPLIAEVSDSNIVALFLPMQHGSQATVTYVDCGQLEIIDVPQGACPLQVKVNKIYGKLVPLGEITKWEDRKSYSVMPAFERGDIAYNAQFRKLGSPETRTLLVHTSKDGANSFLLEASTGERFVGNNKAVSIRFLTQQVEYLSDGFQRSTAGTGKSRYPLFVT
jgi:hypothetical protein